MLVTFYHFQGWIHTFVLEGGGGGDIKHQPKVKLFFFLMEKIPAIGALYSLTKRVGGEGRLLKTTDLYEIK